MELTVSLDTLLGIAAIAAIAPLLLAVLPGPRIPQVVFLLAGGIVIGPQVLGIGSPQSVQILANVGLGFVFLLAGYEVDLRLFGQDAGRRAVLSWLFTVGLAAGAVGLLAMAGLVRAFVPVALGLTTTALGTLLPILRDAAMLHGRLGRYLLAAGAVGELFPILAIAVFLGISNRLVAIGSLLAVGLLAVILSIAARLVRGRRIMNLVTGLQHETTQLTLRCTVLLLVGLLALTDEFHLDAVLGAFLAGMVLRRWAGRGAPELERKLDAIGYGFFVPIFFVYSGMTLDLRSVVEAPGRVLLFFGLMVVIRGLPALLFYRGVLGGRERVQMVLVTATALPLLVALAELGLRNGTMLPENAAALVGAGMLTVLLLPLAAVALQPRPSPDAAGSTDVDAVPDAVTSNDREQAPDSPDRPIGGSSGRPGG